MPHEEHSSQLPPLNHGYKGERVMLTSREEMKQTNLPLRLRDYCAHLAIPLKECGYRNYFLPGKCDHELHAWEKCRYHEFLRTMEYNYRELETLTGSRHWTGLITQKGHGTSN
mmetsp:Transcript_4470/g.6252  ORF Transcript_4470/g.6252 Transcript_4470/m.6252 type:complete len:113 (+) Transcript_4470:387-725(+)